MLPWCGSEKARSCIRKVLRLMISSVLARRLLQPAAFHGGGLHVRLVWSASKSIADQIRTAQRFTKQNGTQHEGRCICGETRFASFPRLMGPDGQLHVACKQADITELPQLFRFIPIHTRIPPSSKQFLKMCSHSFKTLAEKLVEPATPSEAVVDQISLLANKHAAQLATQID